MELLDRATSKCSGTKPGDIGLNNAALGKPPAEKEDGISGSLTERATILINSSAYLKKIQDIKNGRAKCKFMDFVMDGIKIGMPYSGSKVTAGYLKKETKSIGILLQKAW